MEWDENTLESMNRWLGMSTFHKWHPHDNGRFYEFIHAVWVQQQGLWDESEARRVLSQRAQELYPDMPVGRVSEIVEKRVAEGTLILDYLSHLEETGAT